jgi:predicted metal-dependent phosphoesterase TrpH
VPAGHHAAERRHAHPDRPRALLNRVDLHTHSTASDGELAPAELVAEAARDGIELLALTDHDGMGGCAEARAAGTRLGVRVLTGVELSVRVPRGQLHLLGWFAAAQPEPIRTRLAEVAAARRTRNAEILARLAALGVPVDADRLLRHPDGVVGRGHIADALVAAGHVADREEAFTRLIGEDGPAYVPLGPLLPGEAVRLVRESGGVACLAHPFTLQLAHDALEAFVAELAAAGLDALEAHRGDSPPEEQEALAALATRHGLLACGGSDYHGPGLEGRGRRLGETGDPGADPAVLDRLVDLVDARAA